MVARLARRLIAMEEPILAAHGVSMWAYIALSALDRQATRTQTALAAAIGADKTRLIPVLDDLQRRGLIIREPDPADRRVRLLSLTPAGRKLHAAVRADIRGAEDILLADVAEHDRSGFLAALQALDRPGAGTDQGRR